MELFDVDSERAVVRILWQESLDLGVSRGKALLDLAALETDDFTDQSVRWVFSRVRDTIINGLAPILDSAHDDLAKHKAVVDSVELVNPETLGAHAARLRDLSIRRRIGRFAQELFKSAKDENFTGPELIQQAAKAVREIPTKTNHWRPLSDTMLRVQRHLVEVNSGFKRPAVPTGIESIDAITGGLQPTLCVIAAMPGVGKSAFEAAIIRNMALRGQTAAIFCMEDRSEWLGFRLLAHDSGVEQYLLRHRVLSGGQWDAAGSTFSKIAGYDGRILCDDRPQLTPAEVLYAARFAIANKGAKAIFLDNMTAMRFQRGARMDLEIQDFLTAARALADETNTPFVVLAHVKRRDDLDVGDMPRLTDCRESSAFENLSRLAYGLCRKKKTDVLTVGILKNTNGGAFKRFNLSMRVSSALVDAEVKKSEQEELLSDAE